MPVAGKIWLLARPVVPVASEERKMESTMRTMRADVLSGPGQVEVRNLPVVGPAAGEVLVRMEGCGVCASNIPVWQGRSWFDYPVTPGAPGHEGWGRIAAVGSGVNPARIGERVTLLSYHAYAEFDRAPADQAIQLPDAIPFFPGEAVGCALNVFRRSEIVAGDTVAILGIGFLGALLTSLAVQAGAKVLALARRPFALELAGRCGAAVLIPMDDHGRIIERVRELTNGTLCQKVIEATGQPWPLDLAGELTAVRGRLVVAGYHQDGPRSVNMQTWNWKGLDVINAHERDPRLYVEGMRLAVAAVASGRLDLAPLCTHTFALEQLGEAYQLMLERPDGFLKGMILF
jgi:2-desacetyl-2-hydroxyethyl bacteriochlorophyllide A dehydrogenase